MSTYNGEYYLDSQIKSVLNQQFDQKQFKLELYCRDDGSTDGTNRILKKFAARDKLHILKNSGTNKGVVLSFFNLLQNITADYYYFCDQDDIWNLDKVARFQYVFEKSPNNIPCGVYSDLLLVDGNNRSLGTTMMMKNKWSYNEVRDFSFLTFHVRVTGAAFAINKAARDKIISINGFDIAGIRMHDSFAALIVAGYNNLHFIPETTVRYRQHGDNVVGANFSKKSIFDIPFRIKKMRQCFNDLNLIKKSVNTDDMPAESVLWLNQLDKFANMNEKSKRINLIIRNFDSNWKKIGLGRLLLLIFL